MLTHLSISQFAIVEAVELSLAQGLTTITGETGAGKSIALDALQLCLGQRADASMVRPGAKQADISANFDVASTPTVLAWLNSNGFAVEDNECVIRRVITAEGRSRAYINGAQVASSQLKQLAPLLINIHGQSANSRLLRSDEQLALVDAYADHPQLLQAVKNSYQLWQSSVREQKQLAEQHSQQQAQMQLLSYQVEELDNFALAEHEFHELEQQHALLSSSYSRIEAGQIALQCLSNDAEADALSLTQRALHQLQQLADVDPQATALAESLQEALVLLDDARHSLAHYVESVEADPETLAQVENRLSQCIELARKHQVRPETLYQHHQALSAALLQIATNDERLGQLEVITAQQYQQLLVDCQALHHSRERTANELAALLTEQARPMNMPHFQAQFRLSQNNQPTASGFDQCQLWVSTNKGQTMGEMSTIASGGELARINLIVQVISAQRLAIPTLVFDEIDIGVSGPTALIVGRLLRQIGEMAQVLCITHLPQVAAQGHQQLLVRKWDQDDATVTQVIRLNDEQRVEELARLLGGDQLSAHSLANARELLCA